MKVRVVLDLTLAEEGWTTDQITHYLIDHLVTEKGDNVENICLTVLPSSERPISNAV